MKCERRSSVKVQRAINRTAPPEVKARLAASELRCAAYAFTGAPMNPNDVHDMAGRNANARLLKAAIRYAEATAALVPAHDPVHEVREEHAPPGGGDPGELSARVLNGALEGKP